MRFVTRLGIAILALGMSFEVLAQGSGRELDMFVGSWKEDRSRGVVPPTIRYPLRFQLDKSGGLEEHRGPDKNTTTQPVRFDGTIQSLAGGSTSTWKQIDDRTFEQVRTRSGTVIRTRRLMISTEGKALTEEVSDFDTSDGSPMRMKAVYRRDSAVEPGLAGRWEPVSMEGDPLNMRIERSGPNTLRFSATYVPAYELTLDGKPRQAHGSATPALQATTTSARLLSDGSLDMRTFRNNSETVRTVSVVSADGKTLTNTVTNVGTGAPAAVFVFVKQ